MEAKYASLRDRFAGFGSLIKAQSDKLRGSGITLDFEADFNALIRSEGVSVSLVNALVILVDYREKVVILQKFITERTINAGKFVITATQMLESM